MKGLITYAASPILYCFGLYDVEISVVVIETVSFDFVLISRGVS